MALSVRARVVKCFPIQRCNLLLYKRTMLQGLTVFTCTGKAPAELNNVDKVLKGILVNNPAGE